MIVIKRGNKKNEFEVYKKENEEVKNSILFWRRHRKVTDQRSSEEELLLKHKDAIILLRDGEIYNRKVLLGLFVVLYLVIIDYLRKRKHKNK